MLEQYWLIGNKIYLMANENLHRGGPGSSIIYRASA